MDYRLYFMDFRARHIDWFEPIRAESDASAVAKANGRRCAKPLELWQQGRKISTFAAL